MEFNLKKLSPQGTINYNAYQAIHQTYDKLTFSHLYVGEIQINLDAIKKIQALEAKSVATKLNFEGFLRSSKKFGVSGFGFDDILKILKEYYFLIKDISITDFQTQVDSLPIDGHHIQYNKEINRAQISLKMYDIQFRIYHLFCALQGIQQFCYPDESKITLNLRLLNQSSSPSSSSSSSSSSSLPSSPHLTATGQIIQVGISEFNQSNVTLNEVSVTLDISQLTFGFLKGFIEQDFKNS